MKKNIKVMLLCLAMLSIGFGGAYAWMVWRSESTNITVEIEDAEIVYDGGDNITGTLLPTYTKDKGISKTMSVYKTNPRYEVAVTFYLDIKTLPSSLQDRTFKWEMYKGTSLIKNGNFENVSEGDVITITAPQMVTDTAQEYTLYLWIDANFENNPEMQGAVFSFDVYAESTNNPENIVIANNVEPNIPELISGMIPVMYDQGKNTWVIADTTNENTTYEWYDYFNQKWANAVMVSSNTRSIYGAEAIGSEVKEEDILAYYVWIPRYKYVLFNTTAGAISPQEIQVEFESVAAEKSTGTTNGEWLTHPAFTFGDQELSGLWIGKFETTGNADIPTIKPNLKSLRNQNVSTQFETAQKFNSTTYINSAGVSSIDAHMMKNTEWGAVAYLSYSKYGNVSELCMNNSSSYYTGRSGGNVGGSIETVTAHFPDSGDASVNEYFTYGYYTYNDFSVAYDGTVSTVKDGTVGKGTCASTTGNVYGIYDMSGGAWEYVMGVLADPDGAPRSGYTARSYTIDEATSILGRTDGIAVEVWNSGYNGLVYGKDSDGSTMYVTDGKEWPDAKYYNLYTGGSYISNKILGDATGEVRNWYSDYDVFVSTSSPWLTRGGRYANSAGSGLFSFNDNDGPALDWGAFRVVAAPIS